MFFIVIKVFLSEGLFLRPEPSFKISPIKTFLLSAINLPESVMYITDFTINPQSVVADGVESITASAVIMNENSYVSDEPVRFTIKNGAALFSNGSSSIVILSNTLGAVSASLTDTIEETVAIELSLQNDKSVYDVLSATFTNSVSNVDNISLFLLKDRAKADGTDENEVVIQSLSGSMPVAGAEVTAALSNNGVFINGESRAIIKTNSNGKATLPFFSTKAGTCVFTVYLSDNIAVYNSIVASFTAVSPSISLKLDVLSDNAHANGAAVNCIKATVTDDDKGTPLSEKVVTFSLNSNSAAFENGSDLYNTTTDSRGEAYASLSDTKAEEVSVTVMCEDMKEKTLVHFSENNYPLSIGSFYNKNKKFSPINSIIIWEGAEVFFSASGGSGDYSWSVDGSVQIVGSSSSDILQLKIYTSSNSKFSVILKDNLTGDTLERTIYTEAMLYNFGKWEVYIPTNRHYASVEDLQTLFNQWGDMSAYEGWIPSGKDGYYWALSDESASAPVVNLINGTVSARETQSDLTVCGCAYKG